MKKHIIILLITFLVAITACFSAVIIVSNMEMSMYKKRYNEIRAESNVKDSIILNLHHQVLELTYQHEDDDALWEEEQP